MPFSIVSPASLCLADWPWFARSGIELREGLGVESGAPEVRALYGKTWENDALRGGDGRRPETRGDRRGRADSGGCRRRRVCRAPSSRHGGAAQWARPGTGRPDIVARHQRGPRRAVLHALDRDARLGPSSKRGLREVASLRCGPSGRRKSRPTVSKSREMLEPRAHDCRLTSLRLNPVDTTASKGVPPCVLLLGSFRSSSISCCWGASVRRSPRSGRSTLS